MNTHLNPPFCNSKGKDNLHLSDQDRKVYNLFSSGKSYSVVDLTTILFIADPRSNIKHLRDKGVPILDYWETSTNKARYKRYYLDIKKDV